jgi:hypothetical protein
VYRRRPQKRLRVLLLLGTVKEQARIRAAAGDSNCNLAAAFVMSSHRIFGQGAEGGETHNRTCFSTLYPNGFPYRVLLVISNYFILKLISVVALYNGGPAYATHTSFISVLLQKMFR